MGPTPSVVAPAPTLPRAPSPTPVPPLITPVPPLPTPTCSSTTSAPSRSAPTPRRLPSSSTSPRWTASPSSTPPLTTPRSPSTPTRSSTTWVTETFAGSSYLELCSGCADSMADGGTNTDTGSEIQTDGNFGGGFDLKRGEQLMLGSATKFDAQLSVVVDQVALFNDGSTPATVGVSSTAGALGTKAATIAANSDVAIYKVHNTAGYKPVIVTESASNTNYQYVSQCSNRGACDGSTGICS